MRAVIAGAGETGRLLAHELSTRNHDVVLIDRDAAVLALAETGLDVQTAQGDCTHRQVQRRVEVAQSHAYIALTDDSGANVLSAALAHAAGCPLTIARVDEPAVLDGRQALEIGVLGVDFLFCPAYLAVGELLRGLVATACSGVSSLGWGTVHLATVPVLTAAPHYGKAASAVHVEGVSLLGVLRDRELRPAADVSRLEVDDALVILGPAASMPAAVRQLTGGPRRRHLVVGAGDTGVQLARLLAAGGDRVSLVDNNPARCAAVSAELADVTVLHGDGTNVTFLRDLQVETVDAVAAVTGEDEVNLMVSLLARQLGVAHTFIEVHRPGYAELYSHLGIAGAVGTYEVLARAATEAIAHRRVTPRGKLPGTALWAVEALVESAAPPPIGSLTLPAGGRVLALLRDRALVLHDATTRPRPGDVLVLLVPQRGIAVLAREGL